MTGIHCWIPFWALKGVRNELVLLAEVSEEVEMFRQEP
jgi:hypothetical protein